MAALMVIGIPVLSFLAYAVVGAPDYQAQLAASQSNQQPTAADVNEMIAQIQARLDQHPEDGEAWYAMAQARKFKGDLAGAVQAYQRANESAPDNPTVMADLAEAIALTRNRDFSGEPEQILRRAYAVAPEHPKVNALLGASLYQQGKQQEALPFLKNFVTRIDPQSEQATQINRIIAGIEQQGAGANPSGETRQAGKPTQGSPAGLVSGEITLTGAPPADGATLFISARLPSGPRMPFAAIRLPVAEFPLRFELSDNNAMAPSRLLSSADKVVIEARISESGQAMRQPGDRFGVSAVVTPGDAQVNIEINQRVP
jgi:cytochrome c-type biogenesis protein CcmH